MTTDFVSVRTREDWWLDTYNAALAGVLANFKDAKIDDSTFEDISDGVRELARLIADETHGPQADLILPP